MKSWICDCFGPTHPHLEGAVWPIGVPCERQANRTRHTNPTKQSYDPCKAWIICCVLPTWWLLRGGCTRSHSEHGRETPQRQWYSVLRRGRVGRCQVCKTQHSSSSQRTPSAQPIQRAAASGLSSFKRKAGKKKKTRPIMVRPLQETNPIGFAPAQSVIAKTMT